MRKQKYSLYLLLLYNNKGIDGSAQKLKNFGAKTKVNKIGVPQHKASLTWTLTKTERISKKGLVCQPKKCRLNKCTVYSWYPKERAV